MMKKVSLRHTVALALTLTGIWSQIASAAVWYVDNTPGRGGSDNNAGSSLRRPFLSIQKAASVATAGDTVLVRGGTYRETVTPLNSGRAGAPIIYRPYREEIVTISGADPLSGWVSVGNGVYRAPMQWNYTDFFGSHQVFVNGRMVELARWPNNTGTLTMPTNARVVSAVDAGEDRITFTMDKSFDEPDGRWDGAQVWVNLAYPGPDGTGMKEGHDGQGQTGDVVSTNRANRTITVARIDKRTFNNGGNNPRQPWGVGQGTEIFLFKPRLSNLTASGGVQNGIDAGEWLVADGQIYLHTPDGSEPRQSVEAKRRTFAFDLSGKAYITVQGFKIFAASVTTDVGAASRTSSVASANHIVLDGLDAQYLTHFTDQTGNFQMQWLQKSGIILSGANNTLQNSWLRWSAGPCVSVIGRNNRVLNNIIRDANYSVSEAGALDTGRTYDPALTTSLDHEIAYNTIYDTPQQGMNIRALINSNPATPGVARVHHNLIHDVMLRSHDSAAIDQFGTDAQWVRIDHNVIYNMPKFLHIGVYLDFGQRYIIDHNVIYNVDRPIQINWTDARQPTGARVFNNTCLTPTLRLEAILNGVAKTNKDTIVSNNISTNGVRFGEDTIVSHNIEPADTMFVDATNPNPALRNYQLRATAVAAIDKGTDVTPWSDPVLGRPDIGAYEYGKEPWQAGARITPIKNTSK